MNNEIKLNNVQNETNQFENKLENHWGELSSLNEQLMDTTKLTETEINEIINCKPLITQNIKLNTLNFNERKNLNLPLICFTNQHIMNTIELLRILRKLDMNSEYLPTETEMKLINDEYNDEHNKHQQQQQQQCQDEAEISYSEETINQLVKRSILLMIAHSGYELTNESIVDYLNGLCSHFIKRITDMLKIVMDTEYLRDHENDFATAIDRVFTNIGYPIPVLQQYQSNIFAYKNNLVKEIKRRMCHLKDKPLINYQYNLV